MSYIIISSYYWSKYIIKIWKIKLSIGVAISILLRWKYYMEEKSRESDGVQEFIWVTKIWRNLILIHEWRVGRKFEKLKCWEMSLKSISTLM